MVELVMTRCAGQLRDGTTCTSVPVRGSDYCQHHTRQEEAQEKVLRNVRDRLADDAAKDYERIRDMLREAINAQTTRWGTCSCGKRVAVDVPDHAARVRAVQLWLDQGFGKLAQTVEYSENASVTAGLSDETKATLLEALAKLEHEHEDEEQASRIAGGLSTNGKGDDGC